MKKKAKTLDEVLCMVGQDTRANRALRTLAACYEAHLAATWAESWPRFPDGSLGPVGKATHAAVDAALRYAAERVEAAGFGGENGAKILAALREACGVQS